ncbi:MAG: T9SS type A sorting domain-containing protein [Bacteroidota bacterium]
MLFRKKCTLLLLLYCMCLGLFAQTPVSSVVTSTKTATSSSYTSSSITYNWGQTSDVYLDSIVISGTTFGIGADVYGKSIQFKRVDNASATGTRCQVFVERISDTNLDATYPEDASGDCSMEKALLEPIINRGALDVFHNVFDGVEYPNNIERVDILTYGIISPATSLLDELGFFASEKRGNNDFKAAAILSVDASGEPASYGTLVTINGTPHYGTFGTSYNFRFFKDAASSPHGLPEPFYNSTEQVGYTFLSFQDLGLTEGQKIYGISFFGSDVDAVSHTLTDPTTFPDNTNEGADIHGGLGSIFHTSNINLSELIDSDGDGIADGDDIDDDNDGIPDVDECGTTASNWSISSNASSSASHSNLGQIIDGALTANISVSTTATMSATASTNLASFQENVDQYITISSDLPLANLELFFQHIYNTGTDTTFIGDFEVELWDGTVINNSAFTAKSGSNGFPLIANSTETPFSILTKGGKEYAYDDTNNNAPDQHYGMLSLDAAGLGAGIKRVTFEVIGGPSGNSGLGLTAMVVQNTDGDAYINCLDLDSDNDGIPDIVEAGGTDSDGDGRVDVATDTDGDGLVDTYDNDDTDGPAVSGCTFGVDCNLSSSTSSLLDTNADGTNDEDGDFDGDGLANWIDLDSDYDGILDIIEAGGTDSNGDGVGDTSTDADGDGYFDSFDTDASDGPAGIGTNGTSLMTVAADGGDTDSRPEYSNAAGTGDSDGDDVPDFLDVDSDNDGLFDIYEAQGSNSYTIPTGSDDDKDGIDNTYDDDDVNWGGAGAAGLTPVNTNSGSDSEPDYIDTDSDGDGFPDIHEAWDSNGDGNSDPDGSFGSCTTDTDGDGYVDCFDSNTSNSGIWTTYLTPPADDGTGGSTTSVGVDITAANMLDDIFPNNASGSNVNEPDWRDFGSPFPVEWLSFEAIQVEADALIKWSTASEINADIFEIERSLDGNFFQTIGVEEAAGNSLEINTYSFQDKGISSLNTSSLYYRLRQVDINGSFEYSRVVELSLVQEKQGIQLKIRPNPVQDNLRLSYSKANNGNLPLEIFSSSGQKLYAGQIQDQEGELNIRVADWPQGAYFLRVSEDRNTIVRFLVMHP